MSASQTCRSHSENSTTVNIEGIYAGKLLLLLKLDEKWYAVYVIDAAA